MSIRSRTWTSPAGETKSAWEVSYRDAAGARRRKLFDRKKDADDYHAKTRIAVQNGTHTPDGQSLTVAQAAQLWLTRSDERGLERSSWCPTASACACTSCRSSARPSWPSSPPRRSCAGRTSCGPRAARRRRSARRGWRSVPRSSSRSCAASSARTSWPAPAARSRPSGLRLRPRSWWASTSRRSPRSRRSWRRRRAGPALGSSSPASVGLRASELRGLTWANVDLHAGTVHVAQRMDRYGTIGAPKSLAGDRTVPLPPFVVQALREHKLASVANELGLVFVNSRGHALHRVTMDAEFQAAQVAAGDRRGQVHGPALPAPFLRQLVHQPQGRRRAGAAAEAGAGSHWPQQHRDDGERLQPPVPAR